MTLLTNFVRTEVIPSTYSVLNKDLPSIFNSRCFNEKKLPFSKEVLNTEIGHLFEHILLEYLTMLKKIYDNKNISFSGTTSWNWTKDSFGIFHIKINTGRKDNKIFTQALELSLKLLNKILRGNLN